LVGLRKLCDEFGILLICDEVMAGFGRSGKLFGFQHACDETFSPDFVTFAKGVNGAYVPLGGVGLHDRVAAFFRENAMNVGSTYNAHPVALASALGALRVMARDDVIGNARRMGVIMQRRMDELLAKHKSVKQARCVGLFGGIDFQKRTDGTFWARYDEPNNAAMTKFRKAIFDDGLFTMQRGHTLYCNPPLIINEAELNDMFDIIDRNLHILDSEVEGA